MRKFIRNLRIAPKLALGFATIIISTFIIGALGIMGIRSVDYSHVATINYTVQRQTYLLQLEPYLGVGWWSEGFVGTMIINSFDAESMREAHQAVLDEMDRVEHRVKGFLTLLRNNVMADPVEDETYRLNKVAQLDELQRMFLAYIDTLHPIYATLAIMDLEAIPQLEYEAWKAWYPLSKAFYELLEATSNRVYEVTTLLSNDIDSMILAIGIFFVVGVIVDVVLMYFIARSVSKPIKNVSDILEQVARGNVNINFDEKSFTKNEIGDLNRSAYELVQVISGMIDDLSVAQKIYNVEGNSKHRLDVNKYGNSFKEMVKSINSIFDSEIKNLTYVVDTLDAIGAGDFNVEAREMPGDFAFQTQAIRKVVTNLKDVNTEMLAMIEATAVKGDLSFRIDENKYQGDWGKLMSGLNSIARAVDMPLKVIMLSAEEMKKGNFSTVNIDQKLMAKGLEPSVAKYNGTFRDIISAFEQTYMSTFSYIDEISKDLTAIANGDLTTIITREYVGDYHSIKESLNSISNTLHQTMSGITSAADQVLAGSHLIASRASDLAYGAQEQTSSVQELTATIELINYQTQQNANNALYANELSSKSSHNAQTGNNAMEHMVDAMTRIKESSHGISKIVKTIQDIAFQTNLLALNASVEAARAGENGKGFSVVAEEVRTLATRSQVAANETTDLIQDSIRRVETGSNIAGETSQSLNAIVESAGEVLEIINSISAASKEQAEAIANFSEGLAQISNVTHSNSAVSEEAATASEELNSQAEMLQQLVSFFKL